LEVTRHEQAVETPTPREHSSERLLALLELADRGSRELDALIEQRWLGGGDVGVVGGACPPGWICGHGPQPIKAPAYTTSLDAALSLLPEGAEYSIGTLYGVADVELPLNFNSREPERVRRKDGNVILAVVTAAIKARQP
jgi:hypothetical protein